MRTWNRRESHEWQQSSKAHVRGTHNLQYEKVKKVKITPNGEGILAIKWKLKGNIIKSLYLAGSFSCVKTAPSLLNSHFKATYHTISMIQCSTIYNRFLLQYQPSDQNNQLVSLTILYFLIWDFLIFAITIKIYFYLVLLAFIF